MRGKAIVGLAIMIMLAGNVFAQSSTVVTIGGSYWRGAMNWDLGGEEKEKASNMIGPYLNLKMGKLTLGGSLFLGSYDFSKEYEGAFDDIFLYYLGYTPDYDLTFKLKRTDLNFSLGYSLGRKVSVFGAFKSLKLKSEFDVETDDEDLRDIFDQAGLDEEGVDETGSFMGGGLSLMFPFSGSPLFLFGSGAYLAASNEDWEDILSLSGGLGLALQGGFSVMVGYRSDSFLSEEEDAQDIEVKGIMATVAYTIR